MKGTMGCVDNLRIDKTILDDATKLNKKNISCVWIDVKKAFDSVSHKWLITTLEDHGINMRLIAFIKNVIQTWKITLLAPTSNGKESIGPINIQRSILQGDSFCVKLFTLRLTLLPGTYIQQKGTHWRMTRKVRSRTVCSLTMSNLIIRAQ